MNPTNSRHRQNRLMSCKNPEHCHAATCFYRGFRTFINSWKQDVCRYSSSSVGCSSSKFHLEKGMWRETIRLKEIT